MLRGSVNVMFYDDAKQLVEENRLNPEEERYGIHIPRGTWHTLEVLESGTVIFEVKDGPYVPLGGEDLLR